MSAAFEKVHSVFNPQALTAAAMLLTSASFSEALGAEARKEALIGEAPTGNKEQVDRREREKDAMIKFFIDCGAFALVIGALRAINLTDEDFNRIEAARAQQLIKEARKAGMKD